MLRDLGSGLELLLEDLIVDAPVLLLNLLEIHIAPQFLGELRV